MTVGARVFKQTVSQSQQTGLLFSEAAFPTPDQIPIANASLSDSWRKALGKVNFAYQLDKTNLVYATWAQGFRRGGVNALPLSEPAVNYVTDPRLRKLSPDTANNYELGIKGTLAGRIRYSADIFDIEWHNVQEGVQLTPLVLPGAINIGDANSRGFEGELFALVTTNLSAQIDYTYNKTKLKSINDLFASPNVAVPPPAVGSPLPGTPKSSLAVNLEYGHIPLAGGELSFAANVHYQSSLLPALSATVPTVPSYTMVDLRARYAVSHWYGAVYVNNATDTLGITSYSDPAIFGNRYQAVVSTPRTFGLTLGYSFKGE
jgi:outer membrane receptor protein involved in Fe transport